MAEGKSRMSLLTVGILVGWFICSGLLCSDVRFKIEIGNSWQSHMVAQNHVAKFKKNVVFLSNN